MASPVEILRYLANLTPSTKTGPASGLDAVASPRDFVWLGAHPLYDDSHLRPPAPDFYDRGIAETVIDSVVDAFADDLHNWATRYTLPQRIKHGELDRLARADALDPLHHGLRVGSHWLVGRWTVDKKPIPIFFPAVSRRVRLHATGGADHFQPQWLSDPELDPVLQTVLTEEEAAEDRTATQAPGSFWLGELCVRGGWTTPELLAADQTPLGVAERVNTLARHDEVVLFLAPGSAVYREARDAPGAVARGLGRWGRERLADTAFARLYDGSPIDEFDGDPAAIQSPLPTNQRQRLAIARSREADVSVVSGPPGTGKTHLVAATAIDTIARGGAVLIATASDHAAESVCEVLERHPSPPYVRFGRAEHRQRVAQQLADSRQRSSTDEELRRAQEAESETRARHEELTRVITSALEREQVLESGLRDRSSAEILTAEAPGVRDADTDLELATELLARSRPSGGWFSAWQARRARTRLRRMVNARPSADAEAIERAIRAARVERDVSHVLDTGGMTLADLWTDLAETDERWRADLATLIDVQRRNTGFLSRRRARLSVAALGNVLRTGLGKRAELLSQIESDDFLDLLPLWVGTLDEVERTLPVVPGLFDLVILDEASQINQVTAAGALCRARRVMVVGDPRQLRHVSFIADDAMDEEYEEISDPDPDLRRLLDIRRNSLYDVGAAAAPVTWLDEHFRSVPHLIEFSSERFYDGGLRLMTQHPRAEGVDAIEQRHLPDGSRVDGVNQVEVDHARDLIAELMYTPGTGTLGVLTPFRKQADALQDAMMARFSLNQIRHSGLRVGTVHGFQGIERDTLIVSLGLCDDTLGRSLRFIEDPNLFNVMVTRARRRIILLHSFDPSNLRPGLLLDYFRGADDPPGAASGSPARGWTREVAGALADGGQRVITQYPVAGWEIDISLGTGDAAFGVECGVHPEGPEAHIERHLALRRAGWDLTDAFQSRWILDPGELAVTLTVEYRNREADREAAG